jgi:peptide/nickel transport system ATP-binding protein
MKTSAPLIAVRDLEVDYATRHGSVRSLDSATLEVQVGDITALVGESGSGKSTLGMAAGGLLPSNARVVGGSLEVGGTSILEADPASLRRIRRDQLGFIFQNPVAALDPTKVIRRQMDLAMHGFEPAETSEEALAQVELDDPRRVLRSYPHELSGGMAQRVGIAIALRRRPSLLIADEPTAAIDATLRVKILQLLISRCRAAGSALLLLTHDMHAVAEHCSKVAVMYGGRVVEYGATDAVLTSPLHPYTKALLTSLPGDERPGERIHSIPGVPPVLRERCPGCAFAARCPDVLGHCADVRPIYVSREGRAVCCHLVSDPSAAEVVGAAGAELGDVAPAKEAAQ